MNSCSIHSFFYHLFGYPPYLLICFYTVMNPTWQVAMLAFECSFTYPHRAICEGAVAAGTAIGSYGKMKEVKKGLLFDDLFKNIFPIFLMIFLYSDRTKLCEFVNEFAEMRKVIYLICARGFFVLLAD